MNEFKAKIKKNMQRRVERIKRGNEIEKKKMLLYRKMIAKERKTNNLDEK